MANVNILRANIILKNLKLSEFSEMIGIKKSALYRKLSGKTQFKCDEIERISKVLDLTDEQIIDIFFSNKVS